MEGIVGGLRKFFAGTTGRTVGELGVLAVLLVQYWLGVSGRWDGAVTSLFGYDLAVILTFAAGRGIFWQAITNLLQFRLTGNLAVGLAALAALYVGRSNPLYYLAAFEVVFIMRVGGLLEVLAVETTRSAVAKLGELFPSQARVLREGGPVMVPLEDVTAGDVILVNPGERIPADARVTEGRSSVDQSTMTGEALPVDKTEGDEVFAGTMNLMGALEAEVFAAGADSSLGKIIQLVRETEAEKSPVEKAADRYAQYFVPIVLAVAAITYFVSGDLVSSASVLIVACPCAMVLATPTAVAAGIGRLALSGVLVKGGTHLETLGRVATLAIDKTGTLTAGRPRVGEIVGFEGHSEEDVLILAATVEQRSEHPIGRVLVEEAGRRGLSLEAIDSLEAIPGRGACGSMDGRRVLAGNRALLEEHGLSLDEDDVRQIGRLESEGATVVIVADEGTVAGAIALSDELRPTAPAAIRAAVEGGVEQVVLLTGDAEGPARTMAAKAGIAQWFSRLLPGDKVDRIRQAAAASKGRVAFVGDGVNDAPAMVAADVGIAMGDMGSDITVEAADVVFTSDDLSKLPLALDVGRKTLKTIRVNLVAFGLCFNMAAVAVAAFGYITPVWASVVHQVSSLLVIFNSLRIFFAGRWDETVLGRANARMNALSGAAVAGVQRWGHSFFFDPEFRARGQILRWATALALCAYIVSGWVAIQPGEKGLHFRFGRLASEVLEPGLHLTLPRPFDRVVRVYPDKVRRVEIGYRSLGDGLENRAAYGRKMGETAAAFEWESIHQSPLYDWVPEESLLVTGDENLVAVSLTVQYRLSDPSAYYVSAMDPPVLIRAAGESALRSVTAETPMDSLLVHERDAIEKAILDRMNVVIGPYGLGVELLGVEFQEVHPPFEVVDAYREVASALEERSSIIHRAQGDRSQTVPLARGEAARNLAEARIFQIDMQHDAAGEADRFSANIAALSGGNRRTTMVRRYAEALEKALGGRELYVRDVALGDAYRLVLSDGETTPVPFVALGEPYYGERGARRPR